MTHGGVPWSFGKPNNIIKDFSVNLNPLGVPDFIKELVNEAVRNEVYSFYPDDYKSLKIKIAEVFNVNPSYVGVFNGSTQAIKLLEPMAVPEPNFSEYNRLVSYYAIENQDEFFYVLDKSYKKIITSNPVNPTGYCIPKKEIVSFLSSGNYLVLDEAFTDISLCETSKDLVEEFDNLLIISSFTKSLSVPGLRLGFIIGKQAEKVEKLAYPWRIDSITYYVFSNVNPDEIRRYFVKSKSVVDNLIQKYMSLLKGVKKYKTTSPYILVEFNKPAVEINKILNLRGYAIRTPQGFKGLRATHARLALRFDIDSLYEVLVMENLI